VSDCWAPSLFGKQIEIFNCRKRILLVSGTRYAGKSIAVVHRICRHLWETPGAQVAIFAKSRQLAKEMGIWTDLLTYAIPEWCESGIGFAYTTFDSNNQPGPKTDGVTRTPYFSIRNYYGGESQCRLFSIEHDHEVSSKVKGKRFSMIYFSELSMFKDRRILTITLPQLRMPHLTPQRKGDEDLYHQWIADTNPDEDLGSKSWIYDVWYRERSQPARDKDEQVLRDSMGLIEMHWKDNPYLTEYEISLLNSTTRSDAALHEAYYDGVWGLGNSSRTFLFAPYYKESIHLIGGGPEEGDQIDVRSDSTILYTGWDLGSVNHAAVILDRWVRRMQDGQEQYCWSVLDEHIVFGEREEGTKGFALVMLSKIVELQKRWKKDWEWIHWSDSSALDVWRPTSESYDYQEILAATRGKIMLTGVIKPWNSVKSRVRLLQRLLKENRIYFSFRCKEVIDMIRNGLNDEKHQVDPQHKHAFDALTYPIFMASREELMEATWDSPEASKPDERPGTLITV